MADSQPTGFIDPQSPIVKAAMVEHAVGLAADALKPLFEAGADAGMTREEVGAVLNRTLNEAQATDDGVIDRLFTVVEREIEKRKNDAGKES